MQRSRWPGDIFGKETAYQVYGLGLDFDEGVLAAIHKRKIREHHPDAGGDFVFDLIFDRSVASYLWNLLRESAPHADDLFHAHGAAA